MSESSNKVPSTTQQHQQQKHHLDKASTHVVPLSTYRFQFHKDFPISRCFKLVDYLHSLGISTCYSSPLLKSRPGSNHGYDCVDHNTLNPEIGINEEFNQFCSTLKQKGIGLLLDIVPNHMGVNDHSNSIWFDVLEHGQASIYASHFDINWNSSWEHLKGKLMVPTLGSSLAIAVEKNEIDLILNQDFEFNIKYYGSIFPVSVVTLEPVFCEIRHQAQSKKYDTREFDAIAEEFKKIPHHDDPHVRDVDQKNTRLNSIRDVKNRLKSLLQNNDILKAVVNSSLKVFVNRKSDLWQLLRQQPYYLCYWKAAGDEINYRRFFDINDLMCIRIEDEEVFDRTHKLLFEWIKEGKVTGLRIDHPDGLKDPQQYFKRLQTKIGSLFTHNTTAERTFYVLIEKILENGEAIPGDWIVDGTTGYEVMNIINGVFVDCDNKEAMTKIYADFVKEENNPGLSFNFDLLLYECKKLVLTMSMESELNNLANQFYNLIKTVSKYSDLSFRQGKLMLVEFIATFPVYRTYISPSHTLPNEIEQEQIRKALNDTKKWNKLLDPLQYESLENVLFDKVEMNKNARLEFIARLQQLLGPLMAKGLEDTTFYRYFLLSSLNEVGGDPSHFGVPLKDFHKDFATRAYHLPHSMVSTTTHDTKRSEDARARINVLSEIPTSWEKFIKKLSEMTRKYKVDVPGAGLSPQKNDEYLLYQTLIGAWPLERVELQADWKTFILRIQNYMIKSIKESKVYTRWTNPNIAYEEATSLFVQKILEDKDFISTFREFQQNVSDLGKLNSLTQLVLKCTLPGSPDIYQGTELWDFSLVDPDNRRPVNYDLRIEMLSSIQKIAGNADVMKLLRKNTDDGRIKMYILHKLLMLRLKYKDLFQNGTYTPLTVSGPKQNNIIAFLREHSSHRVLVVVSRFYSQLKVNTTWDNTVISLPTKDILTNRRLRDILSNRIVNPTQTDNLNVTELLSYKFPIAVFELEQKE